MLQITALTTEIYNTLKKIVGVKQRVFPLVATEGASLPFIVFERSNLYENPTKDGGDTGVDFTIKIVTATYFDGLNIADYVRDAMRHFESIYHIKPRLTGATEEYTTDGYLQTLSFSF